MIGTVLMLGLAAVAATYLIAWFVRLERRGKTARIVVGILAFTVVDACLWADQTVVPNGLFPPGILRIPEVLAACAPGARFVVRARPRRIGPVAFAMVLWAGWWTTAFVLGMLNHADMTTSLYELKTVVYVGGGFALAAGVPASDYLRERPGILRLIVPFAIAAAVMGIMTKSGNVLSLSIPTMETPDLGTLGADLASLFVALGLLALVMAAVYRKRAIYFVLAAVPLILGAAVAEQRAALVGVAVSAAILVIAACLPPSARRFRTTPTEVGVVVAIGVALVTTIILIPVATAGKLPSVPLVSELVTTFTGKGKQDSAQQRVNQIDSSIPIIEEQPVIGWGLGKTVRYYVAGRSEVDDTYITHNIVLDMLVRTGAVGLLLFVIVVGLVIRDGIQAWRFHPDNAVAAFALASIAIVGGLLAKGLVESIFEKYRLAMFLGLFMGFAHAAALESARARARMRGRRLISAVPER